MLLNDVLVDLGQEGIFALSVDCSAPSSGPNLCRQYLYARIYHEDGSIEDKSALVALRVPADVVRSRFDGLMAEFGSVSEPWAKQLNWKSQFVEEPCQLFPTAAAAVGEGRVLLAYLGFGEGLVLRLVDLIKHEVVVEVSYSDTEMKTWETYGSRLRYADFRGSCDNYFVLFTMGQCRLYSCFGRAIQFLRNLDARDLALGAGHLLTGSRESTHLRYVSLEHFAEVASCESVFSGWNVYYAGCRKPGRYAISHSGGTVEVLDVDGSMQKAYRPLAIADKKAQIMVELSPSGRYLYASFSGEDWVIEIDRDLAAPVDVPPRDHTDTFTFTGIPDYVPAVVLREHEICVVHRGDLKRHAFADLPWQPAVKAKRAPRPADPAKDKPTRKSAPARRPAATPVSVQGIDPALLASWRKPGLQITLANDIAAVRSHLYGAVNLPQSHSWPQYQDRPMMLLAHINLAEAAAIGTVPGLPVTGSLLVFTAADEHGEVLHELFVPQRVEVHYLFERVTRANPPSGVPAREAVGISFAPGSYDMPPIDALIVTQSGLDGEAVEEYRAWRETAVPECPTPDFRLGGYAEPEQNNQLEQEAQGFMETGEMFTLSEELEASLDWELLLQFDSDQELMWGTDMGKLYLMIRRPDLEMNDFSKVVALTAGS